MNSTETVTIAAEDWRRINAAIDRILDAQARQRQAQQTHNRDLRTQPPQLTLIHGEL